MPKTTKRIEFEPERAKMWRLAWDLLLTGQYTMDQICEELHNRGYTRKSGKPWVWKDPVTGRTQYARQKLSVAFHNPFYAGWSISRKYGVNYGDKRGNWPALITDQEFHEGIEILKMHDGRRNHRPRHYYLVSGLVYVRMPDGHEYKLQGSTPSNHVRRGYAYYVGRVRAGKQFHIRCSEIDSLIPPLLHAIQVCPDELPALRKLYNKHVKTLKGPNVDERMAELKAMVEAIRTEEADYARLLSRGKLAEKNYDMLHDELQLRLSKVHQQMHQLTSGTQTLLDGLDHALMVLAKLEMLFERLGQKEQQRLLQILFKRIIIDTEGQILEVVLNPPFQYLNKMSENLRGGNGRPAPGIADRSKRNLSHSPKRS